MIAYCPLDEPVVQLPVVKPQFYAAPPKTKETECYYFALAFIASIILLILDDMIKK